MIRFDGTLEEFDKLSVEKLQQLTELALTQKQLKEFPNKVFLCENLTLLDLSDNEIACIPASIENLINLDTLDLSNNQIKNIPLFISCLSKLITIFINKNLLQNIPSSIQNLKKLQCLDISYNLLQNFPSFLLKMNTLHSVFFIGNPLEKNPELAALLQTINVFNGSFEIGEATLELVKYLDKLYPKKTTNKKYFSLQIEKELQTPVLHYILFFKDYVKGSKKQDIHFEVERVGEDTLMLVTNGRNEVTTEEMQNYFEEYVDLTRTKMDDWVLNVDARVSRAEGDILRLKLENEIGRFKNAYKIAQLENHRLKDELDFLRKLTLNFSEKPITLNLKLPPKSIPFNPHQLLLDLQNKAIRLLERKYTKKLEDLHTDEFTDFLRDKGYNISDQSRSGRAKLRAGEVDIMVRSENGTPVSIIEAFRLDSCGSDNVVVGSHLDKLMHDYDTVGHATNFILVYAEAKRFSNLWENYVKYTGDLNSKPSYRNQHPLLSFKDTRISQKTDLKIGLAQHERNGQVVEVYHVFVNMFVD